jgi:hypothetical protein
MSDAAPELYKLVQGMSWAKVVKRLEDFPCEASYVSSDGTTALHLVVMSRVGYSIDAKQVRQQEAPLSLVELFLRSYPDAAKVVCKINSYTPLAYACLVSGEDCYLEESDTMVRLFLKYCPESTSVLTAGGLSPVDVHIVSYSQAMAAKEGEGENLSGSFNDAVVLRTLLENNPALAEVRISRDKVGGPIEILYRCNSQAFLKLVAHYEMKNERSPDRHKAKAADTDDKSKSVIAQISQWWVWRWTVLILKYSTLPHKKKGARFLALQAAAGLVGCPLPVLMLALSAFPDQIKVTDEMHGKDGNLPLHSVCSWPCEQDSLSSDPVISSRKGMAISALLQRYPNAAFVCNRHHETPLDLAIASGTTWDGGVRKLVRAYPAAVSIRNANTGLYPFMTAAAAEALQSTENYQAPPSSTKRSLMTYLKNMAKKDLQAVRTIYGLLRADPEVLEREDEDDGSNDQHSRGWANFGDINI